MISPKQKSSGGPYSAVSVGRQVTEEGSRGKRHRDRGEDTRDRDPERFQRKTKGKPWSPAASRSPEPVHQTLSTHD